MLYDAMGKAFLARKRNMVLALAFCKVIRELRICTWPFGELFMCSVAFLAFFVLAYLESCFGEDIFSQEAKCDH